MPLWRATQARLRTGAIAPDGAFRTLLNSNLPDGTCSRWLVPDRGSVYGVEWSTLCLKN